MSRPHPEGAFYTVNVLTNDEANNILFRWKREGVWDPRIIRWEVGTLEAEERAAARLVYASFVESPYGPGFGRQCPECTLTVTPHCDGCAACPGKPHAWWCHGETCRCGCPKSQHYMRTMATTRDGTPWRHPCRCRGHRRCKCVTYRDVEEQGAYLAWCDCTDNERAARRGLAVGILMDFAFGVGSFDGLDAG
jgi:hypothetical protein